MDIVEQMAADIAMKMNGGEWTDGKWYSQGHRDAWVKAVQPYADEIERMRKVLVEAEAELIYLRRHGKDGARWEANDSKDVWRGFARAALKEKE